MTEIKRFFTAEVCREMSRQFKERKGSEVRLRDEEIAKIFKIPTRLFKQNFSKANR